jgi:hypothetical protein
VALLRGGPCGPTFGLLADLILNQPAVFAAHHQKGNVPSTEVFVLVDFGVAGFGLFSASCDLEARRAFCHQVWWTKKGSHFTN